MVVADLDRTLLRTDKTISGYTAEVLSLCRERGIKVVFATSRNFGAVVGFIDEKVRPDALALTNGALLYADNQYVRKVFMPDDVRDKMINNLIARGVTKIGARSETTKYTNRRILQDDNKSWDFKDKIPEPVLRISVHHDRADDVFAAAAGLDELTVYTVDGEDVIDIDSTAGGKWNAVKFLSEYYAIPVSMIAAFGDDFNDIEMLRNCGVGVAVANALDEAKAAADYICDTNNKDGPARWIAEHCIVPRTKSASDNR
jgi:Cof subfamily protein (haloacid dehalogenase superfamily)